MQNDLCVQRERFTIDTDPRRLQLDVIHGDLSNRSYWAKGRTREMVENSILHSLCFGVYDGEEQVGFARVVTDYTTFGWLCDVFILESHRGQGLSKWLLETIIQHPGLSGLRRLLLVTRTPKSSTCATLVFCRCRILRNGWSGRIRTSLPRQPNNRRFSVPALCALIPRAAYN